MRQFALIGIEGEEMAGFVFEGSSDVEDIERPMTSRQSMCGRELAGPGEDIGQVDRHDDNSSKIAICIKIGQELIDFPMREKLAPTGVA